MEAFTHHLGDCFLRIVIVRAGLLDLLLQVCLVLLSGLKPLLRSLRLGLRLLRAVLRVFQRLLRGGDLVLVQIVKLQDLIRQLRADTRQFGFEITLALELCLVLLHRNRLRRLRRRDHACSACSDKSERCDQCAHNGVDLFRALHITAFLVVYRTLYITMLNGQWEYPRRVSAIDVYTWSISIPKFKTSLNDAAAARMALTADRDEFSRHSDMPAHPIGTAHFPYTLR